MLDLQNWTQNKPGGLLRPYLIADTSNGLAVHRCGVAFGQPTGGQGWPAISTGGPYTMQMAVDAARLIAAAPALLAACERFLRQYDSVHDGKDGGQTPMLIRAAVALRYDKKPQEINLKPPLVRIGPGGDFTRDWNGGKV